MNTLLSQSEWTKRAQAVLPGGGFGNFDPSIVIREGQGARVIDEDGNSYVDYLISSGPMLLGHGHPEVLDAVMEQLPKGMTFFANTPLESNSPSRSWRPRPAVNNYDMFRPEAKLTCMRSAPPGPLPGATRL